MSYGGLIKPKRDYVTQICPLINNSRLSISSVAADKNFVASNTRALLGLLSTTDAQLRRAMLVISGVAVNNYAGVNNIVAGAWKINLDGGAYSLLAPDGTLVNGDWPCVIEGGSHPFVFIFDVTTLLQGNVDGNIGIQLTGADAAQDSLETTINVYACMTWRF